jgi:hypothetical protein
MCAQSRPRPRGRAPCASSSKHGAARQQQHESDARRHGGRLGAARRWRVSPPSGRGPSRGGLSPRGQAAAALCCAGFATRLACSGSPGRSTPPRAIPIARRRGPSAGGAAPPRAISAEPPDAAAAPMPSTPHPAPPDRAGAAAASPAAGAVLAPADGAPSSRAAP